MFPASYGDSFLVTCQGKENTHILIDMGFKKTYNSYIKQELKNLKANKETISLLVFTHIDADHILGGIGFLADKYMDEKDELVDINEIWYNSYKHLKISKNKIYKEADSPSILHQIVKRGHQRDKEDREVSDISIKQAITLSGLLYKNKFKDIWNKSYSHEAVVIKESSEVLQSINLNEEVKLTVLSPNSENLKNLENKWEKKLLEWGYIEEVPPVEIISDAFEIHMAKKMEEKRRRNSQVSIKQESVDSIVQQPFLPDEEEANGSSIAFMLEFYDKRILFLGDAHASTIESSLRTIMKSEGVSKLKFDAVKIAHHGSKHNTSLELLDIIDTPTYIISTNGKSFKHPDIETIYRIISNNFQNRQIENKKIQLIFNYKPIHLIKQIDDPLLKAKYMYDVSFTNDISKPVREKNTFITINSERENI